MMDYVILGLLIILIVLVIVLLFKNNFKDSINKSEINLIKEMAEYKSNITKDISDEFILLTDRIDKRLNAIDDKVNSKIDENFDKTNKTFGEILKRLAIIDEAQKKIDNLSTDIVSLESILTDKKSRGIFGEVNLKHILSSVFGEVNDKVYKLQYPLDNGTIVDAALFAPSPLGLICIDSKFPLENYRKMIDKKLDESKRVEASKLFKSDVKKHIDAISEKYIIDGITSTEAIMFLPAEAIFAEINAYHEDILEYAYKKHVYIASPTTIMAMLTIIESILMNMERDKYTNIIHNELNRLGIEFGKYKERWYKLTKSIDSVSKEVKDINITTEKITKRFDSINNVEIETNELMKLSENDSE